ncbi:hypothetical protein BDV38DRAFT_244298 [Aspergillus pseudotamarii]|uniref:Uncharacterized protein n=1 Tax=Aspergillus pseudotamarii TaxID=132259 RepID=A0A5N6SX54_ASPPS|nr:uncharacterized protein BDV38DRAFT_244298 [Aspergillus pseudotamarii]KAE8138320.1 hypothetical protein BDV38DRAFT_244298 [Aspergillus pseudotamarii]
MMNPLIAVSGQDRQGHASPTCPLECCSDSKNTLAIMRRQRYLQTVRAPLLNYLNHSRRMWKSMPRNTFPICEIATAHVWTFDFLTVQESLPLFSFFFFFSFPHYHLIASLLLKMRQVMNMG